MRAMNNIGVEENGSIPTHGDCLQHAFPTEISRLPVWIVHGHLLSMWDPAKD